MTHWQHPNFHAYFPTCATYPSLLGDFLSLAIAPLGFAWLSCPACTELEVIVLDWLVHALGLPKKFLSTGNSANSFETVGGGTIESSASLACATLVLGVRERAFTQLAGETKVNPDGLHGRNVSEHLNRLVGYTSDQAHCSVFRAFRIAMIRYRKLPTERVGYKRVFNAEVLRKTIAKDISVGLIPLISSASLACATLVLGVRERAFTQLAGETKVNPDGLHGRNVSEHLNRLVGYTSDQAHCSVFRAFRIAMIRYRKLPTERVGYKRVFNAEVLRKTIAKDISVGLIPLIVSLIKAVVVSTLTYKTTLTYEFTHSSNKFEYYNLYPPQNSL
ncbi:hypothetical protein AHF37_06914 [Paragonimus kellicotti]|nr:hypothetical protein AHF37_06914 [Paragonimus kellicotti]